jgi:signal transduction histidine kinase/ketosteroid isomerase-like protein
MQVVDPGRRPVRTDPAALLARYHRAFNDRDFAVCREVFDEDVELLVDGVPFRGVDAVVGYLVGSVSQFPGLAIASERIVAETDDVIVGEIDLVNGDPASGQSRRQGTACEVCRVREGRIVSARSYYMAEPGGQEDAVRVPLRAEAAVVAEERAALRRVATLVARGVSQDQLFAAVTEEIGWLVAADMTSLLRFESADTVRLVAAWSAQPADLPVGSSSHVDDVLERMRETGRPWRRGAADLPSAGTFVGEARAFGLRTFVGVPVVVDGRVWGAAFASSVTEESFAEDAEARIAGFAELVGAAISDAQARMELRSFAEEQAALHRVATLVARAAPAEEVFTAVAEETGQLLRVDYTVLGRYDRDGLVTIVGGWAATDPGRPLPIGLRLEPEGKNMYALVFQTDRAARIDDYAGASGAFADVAREWDYRASVGVPISVEGRLWGVMIAVSGVEPLPRGTEERLSGFTQLVATAIANAEARAAVAVSRARIVAAGDTARRRMERNLHDGAQQQLVALALQLRGAVRTLVPPGAERLGAVLDEMAAGMTEVLDELREIARGLHPAILEEGGLGPALATLARRSAVPVRLDVAVEGRLAEPTELAVYYVVAEALTNAAKHADATVVDVRVATGEGLLRLELRDDGRGGADPAGGSGLVGLTDRVEALGGRLSVRSPAGAGTTLEVVLPLIPVAETSSGS